MSVTNYSITASHSGRFKSSLLGKFCCFTPKYQNLFGYTIIIFKKSTEWSNFSSARRKHYNLWTLLFPTQAKGTGLLVGSWKGKIVETSYEKLGAKKTCWIFDLYWSCIWVRIMQLVVTRLQGRGLIQHVSTLSMGKRIFLIWKMSKPVVRPPSHLFNS